MRIRQHHTTAVEGATVRGTTVEGTTVTAPDQCTVYRRLPRRLLGIWAHPDDEAYLAAGLMDRVVRSGGLVTNVALSDGEAGFPADDPRPPSQRSAQRRTELRTAMATIGVDDIRFLGLPDGRVGESATSEDVTALTAIVEEVQPDVIVSFGPEGITGHPDHVACWRLATQVWLETSDCDLWYAAKSVTWLAEWHDMHERFGVWMTGEPTGVIGNEIELTVELEGRELERKRSVLAGHGSQTAGLAAAMGEPEYQRWIREETFRLPTATDLARIETSRLLVGGSVR